MKSTIRRRLLSHSALLASMAAVPGGLSGLIADALAKGDLPTVVGINSLSGEVTVNGTPARVGTPVKPGDVIATGRGATATVVIGKDAFLLRENTRIEFRPGPDNRTALDTLLVATGKVLSVFGSRVEAQSTLTIRVRNATIGIRGTGCYLEVYEGRTYFCLCYGSAAISGAGMAQPKIVSTTHHESPLWLNDSGDTMKVDAAGFANHSDQELILLEKLQGREPAFVAMGLTGKY